MTKKEMKNEGPACACGKGDLYEEWLKTEENKKGEKDTLSSGNISKNNSNN